MENKIVCRRVKQNNQEFLVGIFNIRQIQNFTRYTERLILGFKEVDDDEKIFDDQIQFVPEYNPRIQRKTSSNKVEKIADFLIYDKSSMFPTNIVVAIPNEVIDMQESNGDEIHIYLNPVVKTELAKENGDVFLTIIDGQHRIRGIERAIERVKKHIDGLSNEELDNPEDTLERLLNLQLIVTFFVDPILEYQAMIFSTINKTQTKVPENLVFSLFGLTNRDTPQKTSLEVVLALNGIEKSPFYNRIKLVGGDYKRGLNKPLSQATMVKSILFNICKNQREAEIERNSERHKLKDIRSDDLPFRRYYANDDDKMIVRIVYSFFSAVRDTYISSKGQSYWDIETGTVTNVLHTNVGYQALMKVLKDLLEIIPENNRDKKHVYSSFLQKANSIDWEDNTGEKRYPFTSKSINILYNDMKTLIGY